MNFIFRTYNKLEEKFGTKYHLWKLNNFKANLKNINIIESENDIQINSLPIIKKHPDSLFKIGKCCTILNNSLENFAGIASVSSISTMTASARLIIGQNVGFSGTHICCVYQITIGNNVNFGTGVRVYDTDFHPINFEERRLNPGFNLDKIPHAQVSIGDDVWVGANAIILKGVTLGDRVIVGAGSIVTKSFPADVIIGGNPAKILNEKND